MDEKLLEEIGIDAYKDLIAEADEYEEWPEDNLADIIHEYMSEPNWDIYFSQFE